MILLLKRADIEDFWQSVTGSLRWDEHPRQAAIRELLEETGISNVDSLVDWQRSVTFEILEPFKYRYSPDTHQNLEHMFSLQVEPDQPVKISSEEHV
ncbi:MAG: dihydroneopterin triphosphate diphosphatase, partial [Arenicellales bacterium]|nr:dihydroneopterin triphosphate diphosphatase [Arenicellales bacterium]